MSNDRLMRMAAAGVSGISGSPWDISAITFSQDWTDRAFDVGPTSTSVEDLHLSPDGLNLYVLGNSYVYQFELTSAWDLGSVQTPAVASIYIYSEVSSSARGMTFSSDGLHMYVVTQTNDTVYQYDLTTEWDLSTASYSGNYAYVGGQEASPTAVCFSSDGLKMFIGGASGDGVDEYTVSTAWDLGSTVTWQYYFDWNTDAAPEGLTFSSDGTQMYMVGADEEIYQVELPTAWDLSSIVPGSVVDNQYGDLVNRLRGVGYSAESELNGIFFSPDGTKVFFAGGYNDAIFAAYCGEAWNSRTVCMSGDGAHAKFLRLYTAYGDAENLYSPAGLFFKPDGSELFVLYTTTEGVARFNLPTAWDITTAEYVSFFSIAPQSYTSPHDLWFSSDGLHFYLTDESTDAVAQYDMTSAWDVTTASYATELDPPPNESIPYGLCFSDDGLKMYISGGTVDGVSQYNLSTAWEISTATFTTGDSINLGITTPDALFISPNGDKMYVGQPSSGVTIYEYDITDGDVTTASLVQTRSLVGFVPIGTYSIRFRPDGLRMYLSSQAEVAQFDLY